MLGPVAALTFAASLGATTDCSAEYGGRAAQCVRIPCDDAYRSFIGTWSGQFWSYVQGRSTPKTAVFRSYHSVITYDANGCMKEVATGDTFIVGRESDSYPAFQSLPAKTEQSLLITGKKADGTPFLRTVDSQGAFDYSLVYKNTAAILAVWQLQVPAGHGNPPMLFTVIDGQDFNAAKPQTRYVDVTLKIGPATSPYWQGLVSYGSHSKE